MISSHAIFNLIVFLCFAPFLHGTLNWARDRLTSGRGPSILQPLREMSVLFGLARNRPETAHWLFSIAPAVSVSVYLMLGWMIPVVFLPVGRAQSISGNLIVIIFLLGVPKLLLAWAAFASGSTFSQMGAARVLFMHTLIEPLAVLIMFGFALLWKTPDLGLAIQQQLSGDTPSLKMVAGGLLTIGLVFLSLAEISTYPFDQFQNNLELILGEEPIHIGYSGPDLAMTQLSEMLRLTFFTTLLVHIVYPFSLALPSANLPSVLSSLLAYLSKALVVIAFLVPWELSRSQIDRLALAVPIRAALFLTVIAIVVELF